MSLFGSVVGVSLHVSVCLLCLCVNPVAAAVSDAALPGSGVADGLRRAAHRAAMAECEGDWAGAISILDDAVARCPLRAVAAPLCVRLCTSASAVAAHVCAYGGVVARLRACVLAA